MVILLLKLASVLYNVRNYLGDQVIYSLPKMKLYAFITALFYIKPTFAGIEIPRDSCEWLTGISYGVDIKCDGNSNFL